MRLSNLLQAKQDQLRYVQEDLKKLHAEAKLMETSQLAQEREIRRVLGYAAEDEIIFDFTPNNQF